MGHFRGCQRFLLPKLVKRMDLDFFPDEENENSENEENENSENEEKLAMFISQVNYIYGHKNLRMFINNSTFKK